MQFFLLDEFIFIASPMKKVAAMRSKQKIVLLLVIIILAVALLFWACATQDTGDQTMKMLIIMALIIALIIFIVIDIERHMSHTYTNKESINELNNRVKGIEEHLRQQAIIDPLLFPKMSTKSNEEAFQMTFRKQHPGFVPQLRKLVPSITPGEEILCMMIKLNMTTKEIAQNLNINANSVHTSRARLKRKLPLDDSTSMDEWVKSIE